MTKLRVDFFNTNQTHMVRRLKGRWKRKKRGVGKDMVIQVLSGIVAIEGYFKFECVVSL
jgi:hypothetical protein